MCIISTRKLENLQKQRLEEVVVDSPGKKAISVPCSSCCVTSGTTKHKTYRSCKLALSEKTFVTTCVLADDVFSSFASATEHVYGNTLMVWVILPLPDCDVDDAPSSLSTASYNDV